VTRQATALRRDLALPPMPPIQAEVYQALGLRPEDMAAIRGVLLAYDHTNGMDVLALTALRGRLDGRVPAGVLVAEPTPVAAAARTGLPKLLDLTGMRHETAALVTALNSFGTRRPGAVLASMYRHLAHWPSYLAFAWLLLAPMDGDGRLAAMIDQARRAAKSHADKLLVRLIDQAAPPPPALAAWISAAVEPFVGDVIVKMLVICAFLRGVTT
jgi:hypothetical protein